MGEPERSAFVEVNRIRLRVWEWGDPDADPVICVHGAHDHGRMWDDFAPRLADLGYRVVAPDVRGHGDSGRITSGQIWSSSALDLALLARHLGPPVGFVGHSFGGGQVTFVAGAWPELARWVVNLDGLGPPPAAFDDALDLVEVATRSLGSAERVLSGAVRVYASPAEMVERRGQVNVRLPRGSLEHLVRHGAAETPDGWRWKADPMFGVGVPGDFSLDHLRAEHVHVTCPVLVLTGAEHDTWSELTPEQVEERLAWMPHARHRVVGDAGHYVHIEQPDAVLAEITSFLAEVGR